MSRLNFERFNGPIPDGKIVRHTCDNPICVNPRHLIAGTHRDNTQDAIDRGRMKSKLDEAAIIEIRALGADGWKQKALAHKFGVSKMMIYKIIHRHAWAHIP